jgi:dihydrofolate reductase
MFSIEAIVAVDQEFGLAKNGQIPWKSKTDMKFFKTITTNNIIVMGAKTLLSLRNSNPLPNRLNIVLTRDPSKFTNDVKYKEFDNILFIDETMFQSFIKDPSCLITAEHIKFLNTDPKIFIIGGEQIYKAYCDICSTIWLTKIKAIYDCDLFFSFSSVLFNTDPCQYDSEIYCEDNELQIMRFQLSESESLTK